MGTPAEVKEEPKVVTTMAEAAVGTRLYQRFTLQKILGRGGIGIVWQARDEKFDRLVALKHIPEADSFDRHAQEDLKRETRKTLHLVHPNIVRIFDFIEDHNSAAISMEFVDGTTLSTLRMEKRANCFAVSEIAPWVTSLCDALAYAHDSARLIHRDLRPSNLMVNSRLILKITDFGIPSALRASNGMLNYLSPQQMRGELPVPTDDVYALGATLFELLSSKPPFYEGDVAAQVCKVIPPWVAERRRELGIAGEAVPKYWEETIAACLAKNPADRPQTMIEVAHRLRLGGTISLAVAQQETKMRGLAHSLTQARMVGAAAGIAALVAAGVLAVRASHPHLLDPTRSDSIVPNGYATEILLPDNTPAPSPRPQN